MRKISDIIFLRVIPFVGSIAIRLLALTMRINFINTEQVQAFWRGNKNIIIAFWHSRLLLMPQVYKGRGAYILISRHKDGELIARTISHFGYGSVRGSTTRGGVTAIRQMLKIAGEGFDLAVTPDGPRGPRQIVQPGVIELAKLTGFHIFPVTFSASKKNS